MSIMEWPALERPREKLLEFGAKALSDAELLAIFLRTGIRGKPVVALARELLVRFGGIRGLLEAEREALTAAPGVGTAKYVQLQAALELTERFLETAFSGLNRIIIRTDDKIVLKIVVQIADRQSMSKII